MMRRVLIVLLVWVCVPATAVLGQSGGTESPFEFGFGARDLALGASSIARSDFTTAPFWNASRLADAERVQVSFFHARLFDSDVGYQYAGLVLPTLDFGTFGIGAARLGVGGIEKRDAGNVVIGDISDNRLGLFFAYGRTLAGYDMGATVSFEHHSLDGYSATSSPGLDVSVSRNVAISNGWLREATLMMKGGNLVQPTMDFAIQRISYPVMFSGAASLSIIPDFGKSHELLLTGRLDKPESGDALPSFGVEYAAGPMLQLRGGIRESNLSGGAGIRFNALQFDYSVVGRDLGTVHMLTLTTSIGRSTAERRQQREQERERAFGDLMNQRLREQNLELITSLKEQADSVMSNGDAREAVGLYDRALFVARSHSLDTVELAELSGRARRQAEIAQRVQRYGEFVDSAAATYARGEFINCSYYAELAQSEKPDGGEAHEWYGRAKDALAARENRVDMITRALAEIDSLMAYGDLRQAMTATSALIQYAPDNANVRRLVNRVHFEVYQGSAIDARAKGDRRRARAMLDSAKAIYPGHQWCTEFGASLAQQNRPTVSQPDNAPVKHAQAPSEDMLREARARYEKGQDRFRNGDLPAAISEWETVERIAPEFESVRSYLVKAYRLVGIDYYGRNNLVEAVNTWKRAYELDPSNSEIKDFIERTESEIRRLGELSYEQP